jgi:DNA topoisomerase-1
MVTTFLVRFFDKYVDTGFTSAMEEKLDSISAGQADWRAVMRAFWSEFSAAVEATRDLKIRDVIDALDEDLGPHMFPARADGTDPRVCPTCGNGRLGLRLGRTGAFIGCSNYPECRYTRPFGVDSGTGEGAAPAEQELGEDPVTGEKVTLKRGPYGFYIQLGEPGTDAKGKPIKPKRTSLPNGVSPDSVTLDQALGLLSLPRIIGRDPETGEEITAGLGRFGPYVRAGTVFKSLDKDDDVLAVGMNRALALLADARSRVRELGPHPKDKDPVTVRKGRFGPYAQHGKTVANLPRDVAMEDITLEDAVALLAEKGKALKPRGPAGRKASPRKAAPADAPAKAAPRKSAASEAPAARKTTPSKAAKPAVKKPTSAAKAKAPAARKPAARAGKTTR